MIDIEVVMDIDAQLDETLALIGDFTLISDYHPQVAACFVEGEGVGAIRRCTLSDGSSMVERLEADPADGYTAIMVAGPETIGRYESTLRVTERDGGCRAQLLARVEPRAGADPAELESALRGILETGLESAQRMLEG